LTWGQTKQPAKEVVVARKSWSDAELEKLIATPVPPAEPRFVQEQAPDIPPLHDSELTPQQRIDGAFDALGITARHWIEPYAGLGPPVSAAEGPAVAAVSEDAAATVLLRDSIEVALMLGVVVLAMLLWRACVRHSGRSTMQ
jgi:hypothetical protein